MEEDDSIVDDAPLDDVIIRETEITFSLISHLGLSQTNEAETAHLQTNNMCLIRVILTSHSRRRREEY